MGRIEDNRKVLEIWKDVRVNGAKSFDEAECKLLAQQNAILADISRSLAVIADNSYSDFDKYFCKKGTVKTVRGGSDDGEEKGL